MHEVDSHKYRTVRVAAEFINIVNEGCNDYFKPKIFAAKRNQMLGEMKRHSYLYSGDYWSLVDIMQRYQSVTS